MKPIVMLMNLLTPTCSPSSGIDSSVIKNGAVKNSAVAVVSEVPARAQVQRGVMLSQYLKSTGKVDQDE
jgi:hypothetical protein